MGIYYDFNVKFSGNKDAIEKAKACIEDFFGYEETEDGACDSGDLIDAYNDDCALEFAIRIIQASPDVEFVMTSTVDTSEQAGEYMDYEFKYSNHVLEYRSSDWYVYYEEYMLNQIRNHKYTDEDKERFKEGNWFILESGYGEVVNKVPLDSDYSTMNLDEIMKYEIEDLNEDYDEDCDE